MFDPLVEYYRAQEARPPEPASANWKLAYSQLGWIYYERTHKYVVSATTRNLAMIDTEDDPPKPDPDQPLWIILEASKQCGTCATSKATCGCVATDDGPGQEGADDRPPYERRKTNREGV